MKVVFLAGSLGLGGSERQLYYLATGLDRERFQPQVVTLNPQAGDYWEAPLREAGIPVSGIPHSFRPGRLLKTRQLLGQLQPDIVHCFHTYANGYGVIGMWPRPGVVLGSIRFLPTPARLQTIPFGPWRRLCLHGVDGHICNSAAAETLLHRQVENLPPTRVIPNGVPIPTAAELAAQSRAAAAELDKQEGQVLVGFVGWLNENKNPQILIRAAQRLRDEFPQMRLILIGDGPLRPQLAAMIAELELTGRVVLAGRRPQAEKLMPALDILCLTSQTEGMPNVLLEAGAAGVPVVSGHTGGVAEVVCDEETGLLFPPADEERLVQQLRRLLANPARRQEMGRAARRHISANFSIEQMVKAHESLYVDLATP